MKENNTLKYIFVGLISILGLATIYAIKAEETPRLILFFGRFHPLLLHLPIGALLVAFFIDVIGRIQKNYPAETIKNMLGFTAFFAIFTCFLGYFLSLEGGYQEQTLDLHFYTGILTAVLVSALFYMSLKPSFKTNKVFLPLFVITLISISVAGHFGSVLTHGENFLTEYAAAPKKEKTIEFVDSLKLYNDVVAKILDQKCIQCHNSSKMKGELSLISKAEILKGGENGASVLKGKANNSLLYTRMLLPISDEEHMPPEGKAQLTKDEIWLIEHWINSGLDFENHVTNTAENKELSSKLEKYLVFYTIEIPKASKSDIEAVKAEGFRVLEIVPGEAELSVKYLKAVPNKEAIEELSELKEQIVELDFGNSELTDDMTSVIKKLKNLKTLRLNSPKITDEALKNLKSLEQLEVLNIYNTGVTNRGISELLKSVQPKQIYSWQTQVDKATAAQLSTDFNVNIINNIKDGFIEVSRLEAPLISPSNTLFGDTISLKIKSRLKNVDLRYTLNGSTPDSTSTVFKDSILLNNSKTLKIATFKKNWLPSEVLVREYIKVKHRVVDFELTGQPDERYSNPEKLFDLQEGTLTFSDGNWVGYFGPDLNATLDLGTVKTVDNITFSCLEDVSSWILFPKKFTVYASETKNGNFKKLGEVAISRKGEGGVSEIKKVTLQIPETEARFFKIEIKNYKTLPKWHPNAGNPSWLFVDEVYFW